MNLFLNSDPKDQKINSYGSNGDISRKYQVGKTMKKNDSITVFYIKKNFKQLKGFTCY